MASQTPAPIIVRRKKIVRGGHHGGSWKVAYADFVTAMMAFFMVMWLVATMPQEQLGGVAEYFKNPSAVQGRAASMAPGANGPGGAGNAPVRVLDNVRTSPDAVPDANPVGDPPRAPARADDGGDDDRDGGERAHRAAVAAERRELAALQGRIETLIGQSAALAPFREQLLIDLSEDGLRIQIVDAQARPMFDLGSARLQDYAAAMLDELAEYLNQVDNRISISGHTDDAPFAGTRGYSNWELSAERANAARRALVAGGLDEARIARVVGLASSALFDRADPRNPVNRRISIVVMTRHADAAADPGEGSAPPRRGIAAGPAAGSLPAPTPPGPE